MAGLFSLLFLSAIMAIASFGAGTLPLTFSLSQRRLRLLSFFGVGILIGTALIVIIPEGFETLANSEVHTFHPIDPPPSIEDRRDISSNYQARSSWDILSGRHLLRSDYVTRNEIRAGTSSPIPQDGKSDPALDTPKQPSSDQKKEFDRTKEDVNGHKYSGFALILGFAFMFLIDRLPNKQNLTKQYATISVHTLRSFSEEASPASTQFNSKGFSTTLGMVIHSVADGIALGASTTSASTRLELIVFVALLIHKAPAAFGLVAVLLQQGLNKKQARAHLIVFSLATPVGAFVTWLLVNIVSGAKGSGASEWWTGVILLFSGGTFLYVAMHAMHETETSSGSSQLDDVNLSNGRSVGQDSDSRTEKGNVQEIAVAVIGMLLPLLTQVSDHH